jgi:hypothetical protein
VVVVDVVDHAYYELAIANNENKIIRPLVKAEGFRVKVLYRV